MDKVSSALITLTFALAAFATLAYAFDTFLPLTFAIPLAVIAVVPLTAFAAVKTFPWKNLPLDKTALAVLLLSFALFSIISPKLLIDQPDGLSTGIINAYGDIAWHMANVSAFAEDQSFPPDNPIFAGTRLTYPFMTNFLSATLLVLGASFPASVNLVAVLMIPVLLTLLYCLARALTNKKSAAVLTLLLFLFGGAVFGWVRFSSDFQNSGVSLVEFLTHLPARDYSGVGTDEQGFHFLNPVTSLLLPQRSFLFAFPIAFSILILLANPQAQQRKTSFLLAGALAGMLPLFHAHSVLALTPAIIILFILNKGWKGTNWLLFVIPALVIGLPEVIYYARGAAEANSFLRFAPRWMAGERNIIWYWFINTGFLIPAIIYGFFIPAPKLTKALASVGLGIFITANLFLFAPWAWDNFKLFVYFFVFSLPLASHVAVNLVIGHWSLVIRVAATAAIALHMLSAGLDIFKLALPTAQAWNEWDAAGIAFAEEIKKATQAQDIIITTPNHNSPVVLSGRPRYLGFSAHVWSHGGDPWDREEAIKEFYEGRISHRELPDITPAYAVVGPHERLAYPELIIQPAWQPVAAVGEYQLYKLP